MQKLYFIFGWFFLGLGVIGIPLPLLPTTPFVLLSAFFFNKSSNRFHNWLLNSNFFGPLIKDWGKSGSIKLSSKIYATILIISSISISFYFADIHLYAKMAASSIICAVLAFIWTRPN